MNNAELLGEVISVSYAKTKKFKENAGKAVWADEKLVETKVVTEEKEPEQA